MVKQNILDKKKVLIIGAGQIGVFASKMIGDCGAEVFIADIKPQSGFIYRFGNCKEILKLDVTDAVQVEQVFKSLKPHIVIMAYGIATNDIKKNKALAHRVNVHSVEIVAIACTRHKVKRIVYLSSFAVYEQATKLKQALTESCPLSMQSLYAAQKIRAEKKLIPFAGTHTKVIILRPSGCYGPNLFNRGSQSSVFIESLLLLAVNKKTIKLYEDGGEEFLYVKDLAKAISSCCYCKLTEPANVFNIGVGCISTITEIQNALKDNFKDVSIYTFQVPSQELPSSERAVLSYEKAKKALQFHPDYSLSGGIRDYLSQVNFKIK